MSLIPNILHNECRHDRMETLKKEMAEQGIEQYRIWDNIWAPSVIESINLGHKQIVKWAKNEGLPEVLIAEDDLKMTDKGAFDYYIANKPEKFDLWLGGIFLGVLNEQNITNEFTGMTLYTVHSSFYDTFLATPANMHIDHSLAYKGLYFVCNPFVAIQHNNYSDNVKAHQNYDHLFQSRNLYKSNK